MIELPEGWICASAGDICQVVGGSTPKTSVAEYWGGDIAWITPDDLSRHREKAITHGARNITAAGYASCSTRMLPAGTVLYTTRAPIGYVAVATAPVCTNQGFKSFVPPTGLSSDYLYWYLKFATPEIRDMGSGTTFAEISAKVAKTIPLLIPPLAEQHRIVEAIEEQFSRLDAGVASLQRAKHNLARMRASVLTAAVEGRLLHEPNAAVEADPKEPVKSATSSPDGWVRTPLGDLLAVCRNGLSLKQQAAAGGLPVSRIETISKGVIDPARVGYAGVSPGDHDGYLLKPGDILFSHINSSSHVGKTAIYQGVPPQLIHGMNLLLLRTREGVSPRFLQASLQSGAFRLSLSRVVRQAVNQASVNITNLRTLTVDVPRLAEQHRIVDELDRQFSILDSMEATVDAGLARAERLRQSILREAFAGRLVPQDPSEEPASALLERIKLERATG